MAFQLPPLRSLARHALPALVEGTVLPISVFYLTLWALGLWGAVIAALVWSWGAVAWRLGRRQRVSGMLLLAALGMTVRTALAFATDSVFIYFLQPTLGTVAVAFAFLVSVPAGRPLAEKLAADFVPMPDAFRSQPAVRRCFRRISLLWGFAQLANAVTAVWLLVSQPVGIYLATKTAASLVVWVGAVAVSTLLFKRSMARHQVALPAPAAA